MTVRSNMVRRQSFLQRVKRFFLGESHDSGASERSRSLAFERLDDRCLLAADFGAVIGKVYNDAANTGYNSSKDVVGAQVQLYRDDGDLGFDSGDTLVATVQTTTGGQYRFDGLLAGSYFVRVPGQTAGSANLQNQLSSLLTITSDMAAGTGRTMVDDFNTTSSQIIDGTPPGNGPTTSVTTGISAAATIGQARKLSADMSRADTDLDAAALQVRGGRLDETLSSEAAGSFKVVWDGGTGGASTINYNGLGGVNLRAGGANAIQLRLVSLDHDATVTLRVYSGDNSTYTEWTQTLPAFQATGGAFRSHYFRFDGSGPEGPTARGVAGANFNSVGAIELTINADTLGTDARFDFLNAVAPSELTQNFDNVVRADLSVNKTVDVARPNEGDEVEFTIVVSNAASLPGGVAGSSVSNVRVNDLLPTGLTFVSANTGGVGSYNSTTGVWTVGTLTAGQSATLKLKAHVDECDPLTNTATVTTDSAFDVNNTNNTSSATVTPMMVDLGLTKTVDKANPGKDENVTFTIRLSNAANMDAATGVTVLDQLPSGLQFVSADTQGHGTYNATTGVWTVGTIASGTTYTMTIVAKPTGTGTLTNNVSIASVDQCDDNTANDSASASVASKVVDLSVTKTVDDNTYDRNQDLQFTIKVKNNGPDGATGVIATDTLPAGLTYVTHATATGSFNATTGVWTIGSLASGQEVTLNLAAKATGTTAMTNRVTVSTPNERESNLNNNEASVQVTPNSVDIKVEKSVDKATIKVDETAVFLITITNVSTVNATSVKINDLLPSGVAYVDGSANASKGSYNSTSGVWDIGALAAGQSVTLSVTVKGTAPTVVTNTATLGSLDQLDSDSTNNSASAQLTVLPKPRPQGNPNGPSKRDAMFGA